MNGKHHQEQEDPDNVSFNSDSRRNHVIDHAPHEIIIPEQRFVFDSIDFEEMEELKRLLEKADLVAYEDYEDD